MVDSVACWEIKFHNKSLVVRGGHLNKLPSVENELFPTSCSEVGVSVRNSRSVDIDSRYQVSQQSGLEPLLVSHQGI